MRMYLSIIFPLLFKFFLSLSFFLFFLFFLSFPPLFLFFLLVERFLGAITTSYVRPFVPNVRSRLPYWSPSRLSGERRRGRW